MACIQRENVYLSHQRNETWLVFGKWICELLCIPAVFSGQFGGNRRSVFFLFKLLRTRDRMRTLHYLFDKNKNYSIHKNFQLFIFPTKHKKCIGLFKHAAVASHMDNFFLAVSSTSNLSRILKLIIHYKSKTLFLIHCECFWLTWKWSVQLDAFCQKTPLAELAWLFSRFHTGCMFWCNAAENVDSGL